MSINIVEYWDQVVKERNLVFPVVEFEMNGNGMVNLYLSAKDLIDKWNHYLVDPIDKAELPSFLIDINNQLFEIVFNQTIRFKEPIRRGDLVKTKYEELKANAEYENLNLNDDIKMHIRKIENKIK